ncbi:hypothetical protein FXO37_34296 [Capsicum annuum]|nr:hypothetical protein FXO37_34296 [Capsicum annuum]
MEICLRSYFAISKLVSRINQLQLQLKSHNNEGDPNDEGQVAAVEDDDVQTNEWKSVVHVMEETFIGFLKILGERGIGVLNRYDKSLFCTIHCLPRRIPCWRMFSNHKWQRLPSIGGPSQNNSSNKPLLPPDLYLSESRRRSLGITEGREVEEQKDTVYVNLTNERKINTKGPKYDTKRKGHVATLVSHLTVGQVCQKGQGKIKRLLGFRYDKETTLTSPDLFLMEMLFEYKKVSLPAIVMAHMSTFINVNSVRHVLRY